MADQAVDERTRRRPGTGWMRALRGDDASGDGGLGALGAHLRRFVPGPDDAPDPSPDAVVSGARRLGAHGPVVEVAGHAVGAEGVVGPAVAGVVGAGPEPVVVGSGPAVVVVGPGEPAEPGPPEIDPRLRQRRLDVQAEHDRRRRHLLTAATAVLVTGAVAFGLLHSALLAVRRPRVSGEVQTSGADILRAGGLLGHPLMIDLSLTRSAAAIDRLPWVATARVRRSWPDTVIVTVTERVPAAVVAGDLVDASGRILSVAPSFAVLMPVRIDQGSAAPPLPPPGGRVPAVYQPALTVATDIPPALRPSVVAVLARPDGTVRLSLVNGASALLGDITALPQKLEAVLTLVERVRIGQETIDVTVPSAPVLTSLSAAGTVSTHTGG